MPHLLEGLLKLCTPILSAFGARASTKSEKYDPRSKTAFKNHCSFTQALSANWKVFNKVFLEKIPIP
jgi:hypothetical protein